MNKNISITKEKFIVLITLVLIGLMLVINNMSKSYGATGNTYGTGTSDTSKDLQIIAIDPDPCNSSVSGDAVLLVSDGYVMLMDTGHGQDGSENKVEYVTDYVINFLTQYKNAGKLKGFYMYFSHFHSDHYGLIYNSFNSNGTCSTIENVGNRANSYTDVSGKLVARLKETIGNSYIKEIYVSDTKDINNLYNSGSSIWYYRNNYEYLTQTFCTGTTTTVENSTSGCTIYPVNLCKSGNKVKIVEKGDKILLGDAVIDIIGPTYTNTLAFSSASTQTQFNEVFNDGYPSCNNITSGKRNFKTTNNTCTINGKTRYDFSVENTGVTSNKTGHYLNDTSLVAMVTVGDTRYLTTGDSEWQEIEKLVASSSTINPTGKPIDIVKVPHHGEKTGFLTSFYQTFKPKFAFYQQDSSYYGGDEWSKYVVDYVSQNTNLLATGYNGTIKYTISNNNITVSQEVYMTSCSSKSENNKLIRVKYIDSTSGNEISTQNTYIVAKQSLNEPMTRTDNFYENENHSYNGKYDLKQVAAKSITGYTLRQDTNYEKLAGNATTNTTEEISLKYDVNQYTVTFNSKGGSTVASETVNYNGTATQPNAPTRTGYTFKGWTLNGNSYDFTTPVTGNITLTASWEINKYTVTFNSNGGSTVASETVNYNGTATQPNAPTKEGYGFSKWTLNGQEYDFNTKVTSNIELKAEWIIGEYTITFDSNGGSSVATQTVNYNGTVTQPTAPTKTGYTFKNWTLNGNVYDFSTKVTGSITLKATWEIAKYTVTFNSNGGSNVTSQTVNYNTTATNPTAPTKTGYTFKGWILNGNSYDFTTPVTSNITLTASWEINKYTVTFDSNGGSNIASETVNYNTAVTAPTNPTKTGYTFKGWRLNGNEYDFSTKIKTDITLVAEWEINKYTVTFDSDGGSNVRSQTVNYNGTVTQPATPTKEGYGFSKWTLNGQEYDFNSKVTSNIELKAEWIIGEYTIIFDSNGGSSVARQTANYNGVATIPTPPTREGYTFKNWTLNGQEYNFQTPITNSITLTATWEVANYTVTFNSDGGTIIDNQIIRHGNKVQKPTDPTKDGYVFDYWENNNEQYDFQTSITSNMTLTAKWRKIKYIINIECIDQDSNKILNTKKIVVLEGETFDINDYKETINEYRLEKISLPNDLENLEDTVDVKLYYQSTTKVNIPNTMKNGRKYLFGLIILITGLGLILSTRIKNKEK